MNVQKLHAIIKEEVVTLFEEMETGGYVNRPWYKKMRAGLAQNLEAIRPSKRPSSAAEAAIMGMQAFILASMTDEDLASMGFGSRANPNLIQSSGINKGKNFIDGKFGPITRRALSLIQDSPAPQKVTMSWPTSGNIEVQIDGKGPEQDPEPTPSPEQDPEPTPSPGPGPTPKPTPPKPKSVLEQVPKDVNLVGKSMEVSIGGTRTKLGFTTKGMTIDGALYGFLANTIIGEKQLNDDKVNAQSSGGSVSMKMSYVGTGGEKSFGEEELVGYIKKLKSGGTIKTKAAGQDVIVKPA